MAHERDDLLDQVHVLLDEGKPDRASALCRRGLRRFPRDADLWFSLGDSLFEEGRIEQADKAFRRAVEHRAGWAMALARRAETSLWMGRMLRAKNLLEAAYEADRDLPFTTWLRAVFCDARGDHAEAAFWYARAQRLDPEAYFAPLTLSLDEFHLEFMDGVRHLLESPCVKASLAATEWVVLDRVDTSYEDLAECPPPVGCYLVPTPEAGAPDEASGMVHPPIGRGYVFARNILRQCRSREDVPTQVYLAVMDDLQSFTYNEFEEGGA
jgi:tetratricopeptide (TPR) repeat protein